MTCIQHKCCKRFRMQQMSVIFFFPILFSPSFVFNCNHSPFDFLATFLIAQPMRYKIVFPRVQRDRMKCSNWHCLQRTWILMDLNWGLVFVRNREFKTLFLLFSLFFFSHSKLSHRASYAIIMIVFNSGFSCAYTHTICWCCSCFWFNKSLSLLNFTLNDYYQSNGLLHCTLWIERRKTLRLIQRTHLECGIGFFYSFNYYILVVWWIIRQSIQWYMIISKSDEILLWQHWTELCVCNLIVFLDLKLQCMFVFFSLSYDDATQHLYYLILRCNNMTTVYLQNLFYHPIISANLTFSLATYATFSIIIMPFW